jgi:chorismate synthase
MFRITTFGESHNHTMGVVIDGVPPGYILDLDFIKKELDRRKPSSNPFSSFRKEPDIFKIESGLFKGKTTGAPLAFTVKNKDYRPIDYDEISNKFRPGHVDYSYYKKYKGYDYRGGGRASGRETVCRVISGAVAKQILSSKGIKIQAFTIQVGVYKAKLYDQSFTNENFLRFIDPELYSYIIDFLQDVKLKGDSAGGIIQIVVKGVPAGIGSPVFDKIDADIAKAMMSIGSVKGIEIGLGFESVSLKGSENNDPISKNGFITNNAGGILGGITNGEDIIIKIAVKPTPTINLPQKTITHEGEESEIQIEGRHDTIIIPRVLPVAESMVAIVLLDHMLISSAYEGF